MNAKRDSEHPLDSPWPPFLDKLDSDPEGARAEFCDFAYRLLQVSPPLALSWFPATDREDAIQEILIHCIRDDCRVLRCYRPEGREFKAWFATVASNKAKDLFAARRPGREVPLDVVPEPAQPGAPHGDPILRGRLKACLEGMGSKCRVLLVFFLEGLKPAEIAEVAGRLLDQDPYSNVQASNDLRYCKRRLVESIKAAGIQWP